ncbi:MAG: NIPSNAP family protein, partial [SAR86 cluster bacterium]
MIKKFASTAGLVAVAFISGVAFNSYTSAQAQASKVYELRTYTTNEGRLPALLNRFGGGEIDLFIKHGMTSVGYWVPDDEELSKNTMVYMIAHDSREAALASWSAFGADPAWQKMSEESQVDGRILTNIENVFLT